MNNKLERKYGLFTAICMVVGIVIGSGVFFKAQTILQITNGDMPLGVIAWLIGGAIMLAATALFLLAGFLLDLWHIAWVVFPVGGILCAIVDTLRKK